MTATKMTSDKNEIEEDHHLVTGPTRPLGRRRRLFRLERLRWRDRNDRAGWRIVLVTGAAENTIALIVAVVHVINLRRN
jgi:hypothetical protein